MNIQSITKEEIPVIRNLIYKADAHRRCLVDIANKCGDAHLGGSLSSCDCLTALYGHFIRNFTAKNVTDPERDRFILSKGHNSILLYSIFADMGIIDRDELFRECYKFNGRYHKHTNRKYVPGFEISSGSLGHGLPIAIGMAQDAKMDKSDRRTYVLCGDGELEEGSNWEAVMVGGFQQYGNLVALIDCNGYQGTRAVKDINYMDENVAARFAAFGWDVYEVEDGNSMIQVYQALKSLPNEITGHPIALILHTHKACGIKLMQAAPTSWHAGSIGDDMLDECLSSLDERLAEELSALDKFAEQL